MPADSHRFPGRAPRPAPRKSFLRQYWSLTVLFVFLMVMMGFVWAFKTFYLPAAGPAVTKTVEIASGVGPKGIGRLLADQGIIQRPWAFVWWVRFKKIDKHLRAGTYEFTVGESIPDIARKLMAGKTHPTGVVILEGMTLPQIARNLALRLPAVDTVRFMRLATDPEFVAAQNLLPGATTLEGLLFPDTYQWDEKVSDTMAIRTMLGKFKQVFLEEYAKAQRKPALSLYEVLVLASIVEREAQLPEERPIIAAVFYNRLRKRMHLESCATVNYILDPQDRKKVLTYQDLKTPSPYNTYLRVGLPPGPIGSPGRASIRAALNPADTDALFFVARGDGGHYFSTTLAEHVRAKHKYRPNYNKTSGK